MNVKFAIQGSADKESVQNIAAVANQVARSLEGQYVNRVITLDTATAIIKVSGSSAIVIISTPSNGFAVHPRTSTYPTGANFDKVLPSGDYDKLPTEIINTRPDGSTYTTPITTMFPLYDDDKGTMAIVGEETEWESEVADPDNYGIHAWTSEDSVITWRGWPAITLGNSRETNIEGVTQLDVQTAYNTYYTPLAPYIYLDGEAVPVPGKVRGAGVSSIGIVLVSTVNYTQYDFVGFASNEVNPDGLDWMYDNNATSIPDALKPGKVGNYYDELWVQASINVPYTVNGRIRYATNGATNQDGQSVDGWLRIGHRISSITNLPVWFSADGKSAVEDGGAWSWSVSDTTFTSSFAARTDSAKHEYTVYGTPNPWKVLGNTTWHSMYMLTKYGTVVFSRDDKTVSTGKSHEDYDRYSVVPVYNQSKPDPTNPYLSWDWTYTNNVYTVSFYNNKSGPITWDSGAPIIEEGDGYIKVDVSTVCGTFEITATDNCGITVSMQRRGALGQWVGDGNVQDIIPDWSICEYPPGSNMYQYKCNIQDPCGGYFQGYWDDWNAVQAAANASGATSFVYNKYSSTNVGPNVCDPACYARPGTIVCHQVITWVC